jgi:hypothetical protein
MFENPNNLELKKAKVPIPFKADLFAVPDTESEILEFPFPWGGSYYLPSKMIVSGTGSHLGRINAEKSYYEFKTMVFFFENDNLFSHQTGIGKLVAANGDALEFTWWTTQSQTDGSCIGGAEIIPGQSTGKFEGGTGTFDTVGGWPEEGTGIWLKGQGYMVFE